MKAWQIFTHSVRQVFGNMEAALRVSGVLYLAQVMMQLVIIGTLLTKTEAERQAMVMGGKFPFAGLAIFFIIALVSGLWIAVGWHRYVLTEEQPGIVPQLHADRMLGYFGNGLMIGLVMIIPAILASMIAGLFAGPMMSNGHMGMATMIMAVIMLPLGAIFLRMSSMLPGTALRAGVLRINGWEATKGETPTFFGLALIGLVAQWLIGMIGSAVFGSLPILAFAWQALTGWVVMMVGISILTTLYGHYIEKRPLV
jgi:hypothetical protein